MKYFYDENKKGAAHLWNDTETFCKILSSDYKIHTSKRMRRVCPSCHKAWVGWMTNTPKHAYNNHIATL